MMISVVGSLIVLIATGLGFIVNYMYRTLKEGIEDIKHKLE